MRIRRTGGPVPEAAGAYWSLEDRLRYWESARGSTMGVNGNLLAFRRSLHRSLPLDTINDDFTIAMRLSLDGHRVLFDPEAVTWDEASSSSSDEFERRARISAGRYQVLMRFLTALLQNPSVAFRFLSHKVLRSLIPFFLFGLLIGTSIRVSLEGLSEAPVWIQFWTVAGWPAWFLLFGQWLVYCLAALGRFFEKQRWSRWRPVAIPSFFVISNLAALAGLGRALFRRQAVTWTRATPTRQGDST